MFYIVTGLGLAAITAIGANAATLGAYNVDPNSVSVSGFSSGGFMSAQLGVAYSNIFKVGFGIFAGGPFDCARNQPVSHHALPEVMSSDAHSPLLTSYNTVHFMHV